MNRCMRFLALLALLLTGSVAAPLFAQTTTTTATVVDSDTTAWNAGSYAIQYVNSIPGKPYNTSTGANITTLFTGTLDGSGAFSVSLTDVKFINPAGGTWLFTICPKVSGGSANCGSVSVPVTGTSQSVSTQINAVIQAPRPGGGIGAYGYADVEFQSIPGNTYVTSPALTAARCYAGSWAACGGGGGGTGFPIILGSTLITTGSTTTSLAGLTVNGVSLSAVGSAALYLNQAGGYTAPPAGTVTSMSTGNLSPLFTASVATGTTTPALSFALTNAAQNAVLVGPATGGAGAPTYRALVTGDIPSLAGSYLSLGGGTMTGGLLVPSITLNGGTALTGQTGTGGTLVMSTSPSLVTPVLGVAAATSLSINGGLGNFDSSGNLTVASTIYNGSSSGTVTVTAPAAAGSRNITWPTASGAVQLTSAEVVSSTATPTFTSTTFQSRLVLANNVTSFTLAAAASGLPKQLCFQQASSGGPYTVIAPSNVPYFLPISPVASTWSCQTFAYDTTDSIWLPWQLPPGASGTLTVGSYYNTSMFSNGTCTTALTVNPANGNHQSVTLTNADTCALTFTQPSSGVATVTLKIIQSAVSTFNGTISGCKWPGGAVPTITATTGAVDFLTAYLDGTNAYCVASQAFS